MTKPAAARKNRWGDRVYPIPVPGADAAHEIPLLASVTNVLKALPAPGLETWKQKVVAYQVAATPALAALAVTGDGGQAPYDVIKQALDKARDAATMGTAAHALSERADAGTLDTAGLPDGVRPLMEWYQALADTYRWQVVASEVTVFNHAVGYAGTADRLLRFDLPDLDGVVVADLKTGKGVYGDVALQLAAYANAEGTWNAATEEFGALPDDLRRDVGVILHVPTGADTAELIIVDLLPAWPVFQALVPVRHWIDEQSKAAVIGPLEIAGEEVATTSGREVPPSPTDDAAVVGPSSPAPADVVDWLRQRVTAIVDAGHGDELAHWWPPTAPTFKQGGMTVADVDAVAEVCAAIEREHLMSFPEPRPGELATTAACQGMADRLTALPADLVEVVAAAMAEAKVPRLLSGLVTVADLDGLEQVVSPLEVEAYQRGQRVRDLFNHLPDALAPCLRAIGARSAEHVTVTDLSYERLDMLATALEAGTVTVDKGCLVATDEALAAMTDAHGGRQQALAVARAAAEDLGLPKPRSLPAAATEPLFVAVVAHGPAVVLT